MIRLGIIGFGYMGSTLGKLLVESDRLRARAKLIAVCDVAESARAKARELGVENLYSDYRDLIDNAGIDAVIIATPPRFHEEQAIYALRRGLYVLLEKPMSTNLESARRIAEADSGKLMIAFSLYFHKMYRDIYRIVEGLGGPLYMWHVALGNKPPYDWIGKKDISGGMINEHAVHVLFVYMWYGGRIKEVHARTWRVRSDIEIEDNAALTLVHESGAVSHYFQSWSGGHRYRKWGVQARRGRVTVESYLSGPYTMSSIDGRIETIEFSEPIELMYINELESFLDHVERGDRPYPGSAQGLEVQEVVEAIYIASREGRAVKLPLA
ncbi:MAG: Gfo/Idh/MocA family oxidoreductase [Crenarchaeota archaeon]|nr:Gfo/Idh/MocA family oxidoreductase [Thermoproteota archaeon]